MAVLGAYQQYSTYYRDDRSDHTDNHIDLFGFRILLLFHKIIDPRAKDENSNDKTDDFRKISSSILIRMQSL